jgi:two-component system sensor histidine kinase ChiS
MQGQHILIVDDISENIQILARFLKKEKYDISFAMSGQEAIDLIKSTTKKIDLILLDVMMPGMSGYEVCKHLKLTTEYAHIPIIFVTGKADLDDIVMGFNAGSVDYIAKPFKKEEILARVRTHVELKLTRESLEKSYEDLSKISQACQLFVPEKFLNQILDSEKYDRFEPRKFQSEKLTVLFTDVRSYTSRAEKMKLQQIFDFLNSLFGMMEPLIANNHGFVDKFIGDAIMACFDKENSATHAVQASIQIQEALNAYNEEKLKLNLEPVQIGIGIDTGDVMIGTLGASGRLNPTVIGDHVNMAARLESLNKHYNTKLIISQWTKAELPEDRFKIREIDTVIVNGRTDPIIIYEVYDLDPKEVQIKKEESRKSLFEGILSYKEKNFSKAWKNFRDCLQIYPEDIVAQRYIKRCRFFESHPEKAQGHWEGVIDKKEFQVDNQLYIREPRHPIHMSISIIIDDHHFDTKIIDLSVRGAKLKTQKHLPIGSIANISLTSLDKSLPIIENTPIYSRVVWVDEASPGEYKMGISFLTISLDQEHVIRQLIDGERHDI